jgi:Ca-activated chloride channel family protein
MTGNLFSRAQGFSRFWARFFLLTLCAVPVRPQTTPPAKTVESSATISVDVRLVELHASVRNRKGGFVSGLQPRNFTVYEDGQPQTIRVLPPEDVPVAVGLVVDHSGSMARKLPDVTAAAVALVRFSNPGDEIFIVNFNEHVTLGLPDTKLFSGLVAELEGALLKPVPSGRTALYDAVGDALAHVRNSRIERKVLVAISDGGDNASRTTLSQVLQAVTRSDVTVYTIGLFDEEDPDVNPRVLRQLARVSGGETFLPRKSADAVRICEHIAKDIRTQYTISYSPSNQNFAGEYRAIKVAVIGDHGTKLQARTREGYLALPNGPAAGEGRR